MWRGWLKNDQSLEISWGKFTGPALRVLIHSNDNDQGDRMLNVGLGFAQVYIPLGISRREYQVGEEPSWGFYMAQEFGVVLHWGQRRWQWDWPWTWHTLAYETMMPDGSWQALRYSFGESGRVLPYIEVHPYTYTLRSGEVQYRKATVSKRRHVLCWRMFKALGWPRWIKESIDIEFDGEVGEHSGSWKGGCIGCVYDIRPDETMGAALRRMEAERKF